MHPRSETAAPADPLRHPSPPSRPLLYLRLGRVSNLPTVWTNAWAGAVLAGGDGEPVRLASVLIAVSLLYTGGMFLNDAFDREFDAHEYPERPIPAGHLRAGEAFAAGYGMLAAAMFVLIGLRGEGWALVISGAALSAAIVLYNAWHKGNPLSPLLMAACRDLVYVVSAFAVTPRLPGSVVQGAVVLGSYLIGLTALAKQERRARRSSRWPFALLAVPFAYGLSVFADNAIGVALYVALLVLVIHAVWLCVGRTRPDIPRAIARLIAGISLLDALVIAVFGAPLAALVAAAGCPLTLFLQRYVRGT